MNVIICICKNIPAKVNFQKLHHLAVAFAIHLLQQIAIKIQLSWRLIDISRVCFASAKLIKKERAPT